MPKDRWYKSWKGWVSGVVTLLFFVLDAPGRIQQAIIYRQQIPEYIKGTSGYWLPACGFLFLALTILFFSLQGRNQTEKAAIMSTDREKEIEKILADSDYKEERRTIENADGTKTVSLSFGRSIGAMPMPRDDESDSWLYWYNERKRVRGELDALEATPGLDDITVAEQMVRRLNPREIHQDREHKRKIERTKQELNLIDERLNALSPKVPNTPLGRAELAKERLLLEDEVARKEAEIEHNKEMERLFATPLSPLFKTMAGPDKNTLIRGDIERRKKRIKEIDGILGDVS